MYSKALKSQSSIPLNPSLSAGEKGTGLAQAKEKRGKLLVAFFHRNICNPPRSWCQAEHASLLKFFWQLSDCYCMTMAHLMDVEHATKEKSTSETEEYFSNWCNNTLTHRDKSNLEQLFSDKYFREFSQLLTAKRMEYVSLFMDTDNSADNILQKILQNLHTALQLLSGVTSNVKNSHTELTRVNSSLSKLQDEKNTLPEIGLEDMLESFLERYRSSLPCMLTKVGSSDQFKDLYTHFSKHCVASELYFELGIDKVNYNFELQKSKNSSKGTVVFFSDIFQEIEQCSALAAHALNDYDCLLLDNQGVGKTKVKNLSQVGSIERFVNNIQFLLKSLFIDKPIAFVGIGFGAILAHELGKIMQGSKIILINMPIRFYHTEEMFYKNLAKILTVWRCSGVDWLSFEQKQFLFGYLSKYYSVSQCNNTFSKMIAEERIVQNDLSSVDCLRGYLMQIEAIQAYLLTHDFSIEFGYFSRSCHRYFINTKENGENFLFHPSVDVITNNSHLPFDLKNVQESIADIESDGKEFWGLIKAYISPIPGAN